VNGEIPRSFFPPYIENYLENEIKTIHGIQDLRTFRQFMQICASLVGNFFDPDTVGKALKVERKTIDKWLTILFSSYIIFFASPYYKSSLTKFAKKDKLYFCDTGLCSFLMDIGSPLDIKEDAEIKGKLFENLVFSEIWKKNAIQGRYLDPASFWNVTGPAGYEVDMVMHRAGRIKKAIEIKSGVTFNPHWFDNMQKHPDLVAAQKFVIYTGPTMDVDGGRALNFCDLDQLFQG
jgi:predicted AAA+ superfamily ATPase